nr:hypothetical protein [Wolbachia endosymbiont of Atemnus politus]
MKQARGTSKWNKLVYEFERSVIICDYISGMTDKFAIHEHRRIFDTSYEMTTF